MTRSSEATTSTRTSIETKLECVALMEQGKLSAKEIAELKGTSAGMVYHWHAKHKRGEPIDKRQPDRTVPTKLARRAPRGETINVDPRQTALELAAPVLSPRAAAPRLEVQTLGVSEREELILLRAENARLKRQILAGLFDEQRGHR